MLVAPSYGKGCTVTNRHIHVAVDVKAARADGSRRARARELDLRTVVHSFFVGREAILRGKRIKTLTRELRSARNAKPRERTLHTECLVDGDRRIRALHKERSGAAHKCIGIVVVELSAWRALSQCTDHDTLCNERAVRERQAGVAIPLNAPCTIRLIVAQHRERLAAHVECRVDIPPPLLHVAVPRPHRGDRPVLG